MSTLTAPRDLADRIDQLAIARVAAAVGVNRVDVRGLLTAAAEVDSHEEGILLWTIRCARDEQQLVAAIRAAADAAGMYAGEWISNVLNPGAPQAPCRWYLNPDATH